MLPTENQIPMKFSASEDEVTCEHKINVLTFYDDRIYAFFTIPHSRPFKEISKH